MKRMCHKRQRMWAKIVHYYRNQAQDIMLKTCMDTKLEWIRHQVCKVCQFDIHGWNFIIVFSISMRTSCIRSIIATPCWAWRTWLASRSSRCLAAYQIPRSQAWSQAATSKPSCIASWSRGIVFKIVSPQCMLNNPGEQFYGLHGRSGMALS